MAGANGKKTENKIVYGLNTDQNVKTMAGLRPVAIYDSFSQFHSLEIQLFLCEFFMEKYKGFP